MKTYTNLFDRIISPENLFLAWDEFQRNKRNKTDVREFKWHLEENIFMLHRDLVAKNYRHGPYEGFHISDPKQRHIHKASVRDRILHHAIFAAINPIFEETFIATSFSCRVGYGSHRGVRVMEKKIRNVAQNGTRTCYVLKCDVQKFFDSLDHGVLLGILAIRIKDESTLWLLREVVGSFSTVHSPLFGKKGVPIGNLTSQLFANIYMNELDHFMKHGLRVLHYGRYTDDFLVVSPDRLYLEGLLPRIESFLAERLALKLHPKKVEIRTLHEGIDFLGYTIFEKFCLVRTRTKRRMEWKLKNRVADFRANRISQDSLDASVQSYMGVLSHANTYGLQQALKNRLWF